MPNLFFLTFRHVEKGQSVVQHYESFSCTTVNAAILMTEISNLFQSDEIPWENLISDLSDSAAYMRGKKSGLEKRLRDKAPHLLDIDGDLCHHHHNAVKKFCDPFCKYIEKLWGDLHRDLVYSPDIKLVLKELCVILDIGFRTPPEHVPHRWLSVYDCTEVNVPLIDALRVLYFSWVPKNLQEVYQDEIDKILDAKHIIPETRQTIKRFQKQMKGKSLTEAGQNRKNRIVKKLFYEFSKTMLISTFYLSVLPIFKSFVLVFEQKSPQIHKVYDELTEVIRSFMGCFMKYESINNLSAKQLKRVSVEDTNIRKRRDFFFGAKTEKLMKSLKKNKNNKELVLQFLSSVKTAYVVTTNYIQSKFPLENELLLSLSALDPLVRGHSVTYNHLKILLEYFPTLLNTEEKKEAYLKEISNYQLATLVPYDPNSRLDDWWAKVFATGSFPMLRLVVCACLSIFTGPHVEASFSMMSDIMTKKANRMETETYAGIMTVKYHLLGKGKSSIELFKRKNPKKDPVNGEVCKRIRQAHATYKKRMAKKREALLEKKETYSGEKVVPQKIHRSRKRKADTVHAKANLIKEEIKRKIGVSIDCTSDAKLSKTELMIPIQSPSNYNLESSSSQLSLCGTSNSSVPAPSSASTVNVYSEANVDFEKSEPDISITNTIGASLPKKRQLSITDMFCKPKKPRDT